MLDGILLGLGFGVGPFSCFGDCAGCACVLVEFGRFNGQRVQEKSGDQSIRSLATGMQTQSFPFELTFPGQEI